MDSSSTSEYSGASNVFDNFRSNQTTGRFNRSIIHDLYNLDHAGENYECRHCIKSYKRKADSGTSNMVKHSKKHHPNEYGLAESLRPGHQNTVPEPINAEKFKKLLVNFMIATDQPYNVVENKEFQALLDYISKDKDATQVPGRKAITSAISEEFSKKKAAIKERLLSSPSKISLVIDCWTSSNQIPFQGVICRFVDSDYNLVTVPLDLTELEGPHSGDNISTALLKVLDDYGISHRILSITTDNASNMNTLFELFKEKLTQRGIDFDIKHQRIRCSAHVFNLAVTDLKESVGSQVPIEKLRNGIKAIRSSTQKREQFVKQFATGRSSPDVLMPILDCPTSWSSTFLVVERGIKLQRQLNGLYESCKDLSHYKLPDEDFVHLKKLKEILQHFYFATNLVSEQKSPSIANTTSAFQHLFTQINAVLTNQAIPLELEWIKQAAEAAKVKLEKYYEATEGKSTALGIILHPSYKLQWFKDVGWPAKWIKSYKNLVEEEWKDNYAHCGIGISESSSEGNSDPLVAIHSRQIASTKDELKKYLDRELVSLKTFNGDFDVLKWWKMNEPDFPRMAKMARDYLTASPSGVPVESMFSSATDILSDNRQRLSAQHIKELLLLKRWQKFSA